MSKTKTKTRPKAKIDPNLLTLVEAAGVDGAEEIDLTNPDICKQIGEQMRSLIGKKQRPNIVQELESMGIRKDTLSKQMSETIDEFKTKIKGFCLALAENGGKMRTSNGEYLVIERGKEYCMTATLFKQANDAGCRLVPSKRMFMDVYKPYNGEDLTGKTLLVWRSGGIGDLLFIRPILMHLKEKYPKCRIILGTKAQYFTMIDCWTDAIDSVTDIPFECSETLDVADYHVTFEGLIERCKEAEHMDVHDLFAKYIGLDANDINWERPINVITKNTWFNKRQDPYVVIQVQASSPTRTPRRRSILRAINTCTGLGYNVILCDSPRGRRNLDEFRAMADDRDKIINFSYHTKGLQDAIQLITDAVLVIGPDSSQVHIAAMQGVPAVGIYGPFPARVRTSRYPLCSHIEPKASKVCRFNGQSCFRHAYLSCDHVEACWDNLDDDKLAELIESKLTKSVEE